jgi:hypothetical protein
MSYSDDEVKRAADVKMWLESRINELQTELASLEKVKVLVDSVLKRSSFVSALALTPTIAHSVSGTSEEVGPSEQQFQETRTLKRTRDGLALANAHISSGKVVVSPASSLSFEMSTPPFKSFFINRILEGMRTRDSELVAQQKISKAEMLTYEIAEQNGKIDKIIVNNYRDPSRLTEILNTTTWVFSRMLEKK